MKIVLITPYPEKNNVHAKNTGVGSYSYYLTKALATHTGVTTWAQKGDDVSEYIDNSGTNRIKVQRIWKKGIVGIFSLILTSMRERPDVIHIQHELNMFGNELSLPFTPLIAIVPRLFGMHVVTTFHGGMGLIEVDKDYIKENGKKLPPSVIKLAFRYIFGLFSLGSNKIIVHEDFQKVQLVKEHGINPNKISIIAHGVPEIVEIVENAKSVLNLVDKKVLLYMGFAAKYKGLPELFCAYEDFIAKKENADTVLIIGTGMSPRLEEDVEYVEWYNKVQENFESLGDRARFVGFIPSDKIALYYSACDAVLFPYTRRLAASGPMAIAIGYEKDIILSNILKGETMDIQKYIFDLNDIKNTTELKKERTWDKIAEETVKVYNL